MLELKEIDLRSDPESRYYVKNEVVRVAFAKHDGTLNSREGANGYCIGDALITGSTGDRWCVSRDRFNGLRQISEQIKRRRTAFFEFFMRCPTLPPTGRVCPYACAAWHAMTVIFAGMNVA